MTEIGPSEFRTVYGAFDNGKLIGTVGIWRDAVKKMRHRANVWGVYTRGCYRGQGVSRQFLHIAIDDIRSSCNVEVLYLSVHSRNSAAKALYKSIGFETYGLQRYSMLVHGEYVDEELMDLHIS